MIFLLPLPLLRHMLFTLLLLMPPFFFQHAYAPLFRCPPRRACHADADADYAATLRRFITLLSPFLIARFYLRHAAVCRRYFADAADVISRLLFC